MVIDTDQMVQQAMKAIADKINNLGMLNIIVAGKTGVGKSTLINSMFRENLAEAGIGSPVTPHIRKITREGMPLTIYDTRGFELGKDVQTEVKNEILETITKGYASKDINQIVHCIWYCINTASNRIEPEEIEWLKELSEENSTTKVPVIIVLTQSISKKNADALRKLILDKNLDVAQVVPLLAEDYEIDDDYVVKAYGIDTLINVMVQVLPEELKDALMHVVIAGLEEKKKRAQAAVAAASTAAISAAAVPIPVADSVVLVPTQITMIASITVIFGFDVNRTIITAILSSTLGAGGATLLGKTVASSLLKLIPGAGSVAGGAISAGTAGAITAALGMAYISIMEMVYKGEMSIDDLGTAKGKQKMSELFKEQLSLSKI